MKKVMVVLGTRPEAIKMCPVIKELKKNKWIQTVVCVTGQHREMLQSVLDIFGVDPEYDFQVMRSRQTLFDITGTILDVSFLHPRAPGNGLGTGGRLLL